MESNFKIYITNKKELDSVLFNNSIHKKLYGIVYNNYAINDSILCTVIIDGKYIFNLKGIKEKMLFYDFYQI